MPAARSKPAKTIYGALNDLSEGFEQVFAAMDRINGTGLKGRDVLEGCRLLTEEAAAWARHEIVEAVRERELNNWTMSGINWQNWQIRNEDLGERLGVVHEESKASRNRIRQPRKAEKTVRNSSRPSRKSSSVLREKGK